MSNTDQGGFLRGTPESDDVLGPLVVVPFAAAGSDPANSTAANLTSGGAFTGTAVDIKGYSQINVTMFGRPNTAVSGDATNAMGSLYMEFSPDGTHWDISIPVVVRTLGLFIPYPLINVGRYYRTRYLNDGGSSAITALGTGETAGTPTALTEFRLNTYVLATATKELARTLDQGLSGSDPVTVVRAVAAGRSVNSDSFVNIPASGTKTLTPATTLLGGGATYTSDWIDTEQHPTIKLLVAADQPGSTGGLIFRWSDASGGTVRGLESYTFNSGNITNGLLIVTTNQARFLQIVYQNGAVAQGRFFLNLRMNTIPLLSEINVVALHGGGQTSQVTLTTSGTRIDPGALSNRRSVRIKNLSSSARAAYFGFTSGVSATTGDELAVGEAVDLDVGQFVNLFAMCASTGGAGVTLALTEVA